MGYPHSPVYFTSGDRLDGHFSAVHAVVDMLRSVRLTYLWLRYATQEELRLANIEARRVEAARDVQLAGW